MLIEMILLHCEGLLHVEQFLGHAFDFGEEVFFALLFPKSLIIFERLVFELVQILL